MERREARQESTNGGPPPRRRWGMTLGLVCAVTAGSLGASFACSPTAPSTQFTTGSGEPPEPKGALRLRMVAGDAWSDLRGPTACELMDPQAVAALRQRLGPDPIRAGSDAGLAYRKITRSRVVIAALLMDQSVLAGIGNVYRAEILFRHRLDPFRPGQLVGEQLWLAMWADLVTLMRAGVRTGRIETVRPEHRPRLRGPLSRAEAGYVYRRAGQPCRVCGTSIATAELVGRNLFWCPSCQAP